VTRVAGFLFAHAFDPPGREERRGFSACGTRLALSSNKSSQTVFWRMQLCRSV
jgi:hypothetical protein